MRWFCQFFAPLKSAQYARYLMFHSQYYQWNLCNGITSIKVKKPLPPKGKFHSHFFFLVQYHRYICPYQNVCTLCNEIKFCFGKKRLGSVETNYRKENINWIRFQNETVRRIALILSCFFHCTKCQFKGRMVQLHSDSFQKWYRVFSLHSWQCSILSSVVWWRKNTG